jgi:hypothetical protein
MIGSTSLPEFDQDEPILAGPAPAISPRTPGRPAAGSNPRTPRTLPRPSPGPRELLPPRASRAAAIGRVPQALPQRQVIRGGGHLLAYVLRRAGSHVALFDGDFARCSISARSSLRNRAQSARRSSDTNSPGGSGWGSRGDPASGAGPNTESPPRCGNCGKSCFCNRRCRASNVQIAPTGRLYGGAGRCGITRTGDAEKIFGKSANFARRHGDSGNRASGRSGQRSWRPRVEKDPLRGYSYRSVNAACGLRSKNSQRRRTDRSRSNRSALRLSPRGFQTSCSSRSSAKPFHL